MTAGSRYEKLHLVHKIFSKIKIDSGGRFLKVDKDTGNWCELDDVDAKEKVRHALRDAVAVLQNRKSRRTKKQAPHMGPGVVRAQQPTASSPQPKLKATNFHKEDSSSVLSPSLLLIGPPANPFDVPTTTSSLVPLPRQHTPIIFGSSTNGGFGLSQAVAHNMKKKSTNWHNNQLHKQEGAQNPHGDEEEEEFLAIIDSVLGPLPPGTDDPMRKLLIN